MTVSVRYKLMFIGPPLNSDDHCNRTEASIGHSNETCVVIIRPEQERRTHSTQSSIYLVQFLDARRGQTDIPGYDVYG